MKVLVVGSGGREHALGRQLSLSPTLTRLYFLPGNPGTKSLGENLNIIPDNFNDIISFCKRETIDLVVIGPEKPLVDGLANMLRENSIAVFGPDSSAAEIEAHKSFAKSLMKKYHIPSADYVEFDSTQLEMAARYLASAKYPLVIKADGLAAGKGVIICSNAKEADRTLEQLFVNRIFGSAGDKIIIEDFMEGEEASVFAITDGTDFICLPAAQDHKRIGDNDTGKNTGGMGAYSPAPLITNELQLMVEGQIIAPTIKAMKDEGRDFVGCLYAGLMITSEGPKVVEFNCRFGDPETQAVLPILEGDFLQLLYSAAAGKIEKDAVRYNGGCAVCVVAASSGYPDAYQTGFEISGLIDSENIIVFHAGTKESEGKILTAGGRVLGVTSVIEQNDLARAKSIAYDALSKIYFEGIYFRRDIADRAI